MKRASAIVLTCFVASAMSTTWQKTNNGVVVQLKGQKLWLIPYTDRSIRIVCSRTGKVLESSLAVVAKPGKVNFAVTASQKTLTLKTKQAAIDVNLQTGALSLRGGNGQCVLKEPFGARRFDQTVLADKPAQAASQNFQVIGDEGFYGLGCLQLPQLDLRGGKYELVQDNVIDVNPMLVTTGGYGILWDNASKTSVSICNSTVPVRSDDLIDSEGVPGGLTARYYTGKDLKDLVTERRDPAVNFKWAKAPLDGLPENFFSVRWTGFLKTKDAGLYTFSARCDDGVRLWVNGKQIIDDWRVHAPTESSGSVWLPANAKVPITMEFFEETNEAAVDLRWSPPTKNQKLTFQSDIADQISYYFIAGPTIPEMIGEYRKLTGQVPLFGKWAYGFWQCKERYQTQEEIVGIAKEYRARKIPIDNIVQDWFYWREGQWGSHEFDPARFEDPKRMVQDLHDLNYHVMISVWGKFGPDTDNAKLLDSKGLLYPKATEQAQYYDAFNPRGRTEYWSLMRDKLFSLGYDAWWLDATEPEIPMDKFREFPSTLGPAGRYLNAYSLMTTKGVYEGQRKSNPNKRVFILTRSVFSGQQRNSAATWSGDIYGSWDVFRKQIASGLNFCLAGVPYWCTDIGGFFSPPSSDTAYQELFIRWFQWGSFNPVFRVHGTGTNKELWRWGKDNEKILLDFDNLRYRLMPYIYSTAWQVTNKNSTMMRALPYDFGNDPRTWRVADQFMFGPSIMVCPVVEPKATSRKVLLPKGGIWVDFWTGKRIQGNMAVLDAPLSRIPLLVKAGSIVPMGPFVQYISEKPSDPIELRIYPGKDGRFVLYEDEGDGYRYEKGQRSEIAFIWSDKNRMLTIEGRKGSYPGMTQKRLFKAVIVRPGIGKGIEIETRISRNILYEGKKLIVRL